MGYGILEWQHGAGAVIGDQSAPGADAELRRHHRHSQWCVVVPWRCGAGQRASGSLFLWLMRRLPASAMSTLNFAVQVSRAGLGAARALGPPDDLCRGMAGAG